MNNLKYSFKEFKNSLFFKLIIIMQITLALILLYRVIEIKNYENGKLKLINQITKNKRIYKFNSKYDSIESLIADQNIPGKFNAFSKDIEKKHTVVTVTYGELFLKNFKNISDFIDNDIKNFKVARDFTPVNSLQCSLNFFDAFGLKLSDGDFNEFSKFTKINRNEWGEEVIPIILGDSYKSVFKLNDIIDGKDSKYKVVGFLEKNQFYLDKGIYDPSRAKNLNTFAILPSPQNIIESNLNNALLIANSNEVVDFDTLKNYIETLSKLHNVKFSLSDPNQNITDFVNIINYNANIKILIVYIVMAFVVIGLTAIFSNRVAVRKKEFSLHIMHGATFKDIYIRIFLEHFYPIIVAIMMAFVYIHTNTVQIISEIITFDMKAFVESSILLFVIILLIAMIPIYNIKKHKINYLIRGE